VNLRKYHIVNYNYGYLLIYNFNIDKEDGHIDT